VDGYLKTDSSWKWKVNSSIKFVPEDSMMTYLDIFEIAKGDSSIKGWKSVGFDDSSWSSAKPYGIHEIRKSVSPGNLIPRPIPQMFEVKRTFKDIVAIRSSSLPESEWSELLQGTSVTLNPGSVHDVEIDAGELTTGFLQLAVSGGEGAEIKILTSECYSYEPDTTLMFPAPLKGDRTDSKNGALRGYTDTYLAEGFGASDEPETYETFWFRAFRYVKVKIDVKEQPLQILRFDYRETGYPLDAKTFVKTSDESLNAVWDISLRSLKRCMHETYEDCPFYEQLQYAMDTRAQILFTYSVSADDRMARRAIDDFHRSLRYDGLIAACYPSMVSNVIIGFPAYYILMIHDHMRYFGDKELVKKYMPTVDAILAFYGRNVNGKGLLGNAGGMIMRDRFWSFIDWSWEKTTGVPEAFLSGEITMESLIYISALQAASALSAFLDRSEQAADYAWQAAAVQSAVNMYCVDDKGLYQDGPGVEKYSQHCQVWAVLTETAPKESWPTLIEEALSNNSFAKCTVAMGFYLFRAVEKADLYHKTRELWEPWREMVKNNLTTCQESTISPRSDCHAWGALALYELPAVVLGVTPAKPNYEAVYVRPNPAYFDWAQGEVWTPKGSISVQWRREEDGTLQLEVKAPPDVEIVY
jgi:hypothetical protein